MFSFFLKFCHSFDQLVTVVWLVNQEYYYKQNWTTGTPVNNGGRTMNDHGLSMVLTLKQLLNEVKHDIQKLNSIIVLLYIFWRHSAILSFPLSLQKFKNTTRTKALETKQTLTLGRLMEYKHQVLHLSCQLQTLLYIDWTLFTN